MRSDYKDWLKAQEYAVNTQAAQLHRVAKVEQAYGDLDQLLASGGGDALVEELTYSTADERAGRPNPSKMQFDGNIRKNLQSYKDAVLRYRKFLGESDVYAFGEEGVASQPLPVLPALADDLAPERQRLALERDMQAALRRNIALLEPGLEIIDDGAERGVPSGFIDILCIDSQKRTVVIELKAGTTDARVIGQTLGYMGDLLQEEEAAQVRGIIVAHEFDKRTRAAARAVANLALVRYAISFHFDRLE
ncbi:hypothetical protein BTR14_07070 [Rhizobium rhizosphaerae]|uniref:Endonuclease NucS C-terminal domain-containing protein n=1 Tax=Xaviernesmea rhizosphaerae TaxID=1672749 RepID=A0ABX3PFI5_9HYPH|nr:endonuclease NucS domain-containing protein [Xaviernesmea rhizosphaerae]OQP87178.1 hypothetical protein BTR14_07070 [Xaviernesmea rhizosphaerae]